MIKSIELINFRSHEHTKLDFTNGVNVIVGDTESGKSNIMRAFDWVFNNSPTGNDMRSHWGGDTKVIVELDNGTITRTKTNSRNEYQIDDSEPFKAFGQGVPEEVLELINLTPTNFERQFERPFMIDWRPGERGEFINRICDFTVIDSSISNANKMIREERNKIKSLEEAVNKKKEELSEFDNLEEMEIDIAKLEFIEQKLGSTTNRVKNLCYIADRVAEIERDLSKYRDILKNEGEITGLLATARRIEDKEDVLIELKDIVSDIVDVQEEVDNLQRSKSLQKKEFNDAMPERCPLCGRIN